MPDTNHIVNWSEEDEAFIARVPAIPGCISHGDTIEEAARNIQEACEACLEVFEENGWPAPASVFTKRVSGESPEHQAKRQVERSSHQSN